MIGLRPDVALSVRSSRERSTTMRDDRVHGFGLSFQLTDNYNVPYGASQEEPVKGLAVRE